MTYWRIFLIVIIGLLLVACEPSYPPQSNVANAIAATGTAEQFGLTKTRVSAETEAAKPTQTNTPRPTATDTPSPTATATATPLPTDTATPSPTARPSRTPRPTPEATRTPQPSPTPDRTIPCDERLPEDDLLTIISRDFPISKNYEPDDLVPLSDYFGVNVTLGYPTQVREMMIEPIQQIIADMHNQGLSPTIISGYRSYLEQTAAYNKWRERYPDRAHILSVPPGTSEHQLGLTIDFGSPELSNEFHTYFYKTGEGAWLLENAHKYGFTLSYPVEAFEITEIYYEPWHYRYIGEEMAIELKEEGITLTEYQIETMPDPCIP